MKAGEENSSAHHPQCRPNSQKSKLHSANSALLPITALMISISSKCLGENVFAVRFLSPEKEFIARAKVERLL